MTDRRSFRLRLWILVTLSLLLIVSWATAQYPTAPSSWNIRDARSVSAGAGEDSPPSNVIVDIDVGLNSVWVGTAGGLGRFTSANSPLDPADGLWLNVRSGSAIGEGGISGLATAAVAGIGNVVWAATAYDTFTDGESFATGGGVGYSMDLGETWNWMPQPVDDLNETEFEPTTVAVLNVTYDIALQGTKVWIASFAGGLRYYDMAEPDEGWIVRPPDDRPFDALGHRNHLAVSVTATDSTLWVGTSSGINLSRDGGNTWQRFAFSSADTLTPSGNWTTALAVQGTSTGKTLVWAVTRASDLAGEYSGISVSKNLGLTWNRVLGTAAAPVTGHNFAFNDSIVYVASDDGLYISKDYGESWGLYGPVFDPTTFDRTYTPEVFAVGHDGTRLYRGGVDGLAVTDDYGASWRLVRTHAPVSVDGHPETYAYPNPFSPSRHEMVRLRYHLDVAGSVTVEIYDFAMELLVRPMKDEWRPAGDHNAAWDGRGPGGRKIANGVYFYRILADGLEAWNKILVLE